MAVDIVIPTVGESVTSGVIAKWTKNEGDKVKRDETVLELETDKVTMEVYAPADGVLHQNAKAGDTVNVGAVVGSVDPAGVAAAPSAPAPQKQVAETKPAPKAEPVAAASAPAPAKKAETSGRPAPANGAAHATPLARKVAAEHNVDLSKVSGTGASQRIREQDVLAAAKSGGTPGAAPKTGGGVRREAMSPLRQRIAQRLVQAQHTAAMLTTFNEVDMQAVMDLRKQYREDFEKRHGVGLGFMSFFVRAVAQALKAFPVVNASIVEDNGKPMIEWHDSCDIALAVSTPKGLIVPVVRNCERLTMAQIELSVKDLATRGRDGKITLDEMQGGTFTITNGGVFGSLMSTPILNPPQSGILGMHTIKNRPVEDPKHPGQIVLRPMMYLALSYDHRLVDGAEAVQFLVKVKQAIEDPQRLLLEV